MIGLIVSIFVIFLFPLVNQPLRHVQWRQRVELSLWRERGLQCSNIQAAACTYLGYLCFELEVVMLGEAESFLQRLYL